MNKRIPIIIGIIALLCVVSGAYILFTSTPSYKNVTMNDITFEIPDSNVTVTQQTDLYSYYNDSETGVAIFVFDSTDAGFNDLSEAMTFAAIRDSFQMGAQKQQEDGIEFNHSDTLNVYTYLTNYTHKNVFIVTKDKDELKHIISSIKVDETTVNKTETKTNSTETKTTTKKASKTTSKKSTVREEDQITNGWNPKEHEVSREPMGDGNERVYYDDGYSRLVDSKGNILSYGY